MLDYANTVVNMGSSKTEQLREAQICQVFFLLIKVGGRIWQRLLNI